MKRFIYNRSSINHRTTAVRIMNEVLTHVPSNKHVLVLIQQDIKALENSRAGVYYVTEKLPVNSNVIESDVKHYFYRFVVLNKRKRIQTFLIPRTPLE